MAAYLSTQPYKGTRDFYPEDMRFRRWMFGKLRRTVESYGFQEYDGPMLEPFELYAAKTGEEIVNQQLYWMTDRGERKIAVRPEMTPTLARMVAAKVQELPKPIRLYSIPNLWRYERPQRGRLREHWQLNVDILGGDPLLADAEILQAALDLMMGFGGGSQLVVKVNHRGLMDFFFRDKMGLEPETALKVSKAIDARDKVGEEAYRKWLSDLGLGAQIEQMEAFFQAPLEHAAQEYACPGTEHLEKLLHQLRELGISDGRVVFDPTVMRGLDYYTGMVFEIYDTSPENRRAMFGGGRYDNLIGLFGKTELSGVGFGMGDVTLQHFLETHGLIPELKTPIDVFVTLPKEELIAEHGRIAKALRHEGFKVMTPLSMDGFGAQLKSASKHHCHYAVLLGDEELAQGKVALKNLLTGQQEAVAIEEIAHVIRRDSSQKT